MESRPRIKLAWRDFLAAPALPRRGGGDVTADMVASQIAKAKRKVNTAITLEQWNQQGYARLPRSSLEPPRLPASASTSVERVDARYISSAEFAERFMKQREPCIVTGATEAWRARTEWCCFETLSRRFGTKKFKVGDSEGGYGDNRVEMRLRHFLPYCDAQESPTEGDDSPLYVFEDEFGDCAPALLADYEVPHMFREDLFEVPLLSSKRRPPHRWFLLGPARSGSGVHIDPLGTSAWNALVRGRKRWVLFSPAVPKAVAKGTAHFKLRKDNDEPIAWFLNAVPRIRESAADGFGDRSARAREGKRMLEFVQEAGEVVYIPGGWWHAVLNLSSTVAVTHNFVSTTNFERVWRRVRAERKKMAARWLAQLMVHRPELASVAIRLNAEDGVRVVPKPNGAREEEGEGRGTSSKKRKKKKKKKKKKEEEEKQRRQQQAQHAEDEERRKQQRESAVRAPLPEAAAAPHRAGSTAAAHAPSSRWGALPRSTGPSSHVRF